MHSDPARRTDLLLDGLLHRQEVDRFASLCVPTSPEELKGLRLRILAYLASLVSMARTSPEIDIHLARRIGSVLASVLDDPIDLDETDRALLRGATEYFLLTSDDGDDLRPLGFDDDARVVNRVLVAIGRADLELL